MTQPPPQGEGGPLLSSSFDRLRISELNLPQIWNVVLPKERKRFRLPGNMPRSSDKKGLDSSVTPMGQYYLLDKIAQGGMAEIYKGLAYDLHGLKKTVVIKKILPQIAADPEFINMLINEAKIAVMLSHGNIAQIYDLGKVADDYFMVMEYVDGKSLSQIHRRSLKMGHLIPAEYICYFISEVANGLNYMHRRSDDQGRNLGIIHRDISPQNVIVSYSGTVKIIDFGIAKAAIQMNITESGILKGKFAYMSPEQARGEPIDNRADIFSLGVILHELLTGKRLFKGKDKRTTLQNVRRGVVPAPSSVRAGIPKELDKIVLKALAKDPRNRYLWASDLHDALIKFIFTTYPDFQPSAVTEYIRELFKDDISEKEEMEEDAKTPFLIIDHTQSTILPESMELTNITNIPPQLKEFMLDEETPITDIKLKEEDEEESEENTFHEPFSFKSFFKKHARGIATGIVTTFIVLVALFAAGVGSGVISPPSFLSIFAPKTLLKIYVEPPDADVIFSGVKLEGNPPYKIKNITPGKNYEIISEKKGLAPYFHSIALNKGERKNIYIKLQAELPHYAELSIASTPPGAAIFLNEKSTGLKTPATLSRIEPKKYHTIGLYLDDYVFWSRDIILKPDEKASININLAINSGEIEIISFPENAEVFIDGKEVGKTPFKKTSLAPNTILDVSVRKNGFIGWSGKVKIRAGATTLLRPKLTHTKENLVPHFLRGLEKKSEYDTTPQPNLENMLPPAPVE